MTIQNQNKQSWRYQNKFIVFISNTNIIMPTKTYHKNRNILAQKKSLKNHLIFCFQTKEDNLLQQYICQDNFRKTYINVIFLLVFFAPLFFLKFNDISFIFVFVFFAPLFFGFDEFTKVVYRQSKFSPNCCSFFSSCLN